jgi:serine/threonine protein kinase
MFEGVVSDRYRNACQLIELTIDRPGKPIIVDVRFRAWSTDGGFWYDDASLYRAATRGRLRFTIDPTPPQVHTSRPPSPVAARASDPLARYQQLSTVHRGLYSEVRKCKNRETGALCVVKRTREDLVSLEALERLQALRDPRVVAPTRCWRADGCVWEELPYVGGLRLSDAVGHGCGGLSGPVLEELLQDMAAILGRIHGAGVIHRDIHPDNIFMMATNVVGRRAPSRDDEDRCVYGRNRFEEPRRASVVPVDMRSPPFSITWYLVDNTFAICDHEASTRPPSSHDTFTAEEQVHGLPSHASDYYSLGATLYYCILGIDVPSPVQRRHRSTPLRMPRGSHPSTYFEQLMTSLLSLEPEERRLRQVSGSTVIPGFTGLIRSSDRQLLAIDQFASDTHSFGLERAATVVDSLVQEWGDGEIPDLFVPHDQFDGWETEFMRVGLRRWRVHLRELGWG